jgi:hypothetical protein
VGGVRLKIRDFPAIFYHPTFPQIYFARYNRGMGKKWEDAAKQPPKPETMNTPGDFKRFTDLMRKIVEKPKPVSPGAAHS